MPIAVLGATGYVGVELLRLLARHPAVELVCLSSEQYRGRRASEVYPFLSGVVDVTLAAPEDWKASDAELVFCALPHAASAPLVRDVLAEGRRALDMSADFRLRVLQSTPVGTGPIPRRSSSKRRSTACRSCTARPCGTRGWSRFPDATPRARCSGLHRWRVPGSSSSRS